MCLVMTMSWSIVDSYCRHVGTSRPSLQKSVKRIMVHRSELRIYDRWLTSKANLCVKALSLYARLSYYFHFIHTSYKIRLDVSFTELASFASVPLMKESFGY